MSFFQKIFIILSVALIVGSFWMLPRDPFWGTTMRWMGFFTIALAFFFRD